MSDCPTCGRPTPDGRFCVRCGSPLDQALGRPRQRAQFAGAPAQSRRVPWPVSTLFPQLPRHSERHFHAVLAGGAALVIALGLARLFPVALIAAALLMPLLTVVYFYDVDIYESAPWPGIAWTLGWSAVTGVLVGLLVKALEPSGAALIDRGSSAHVLVDGLAMPALGVAAMLAGPLVLLRDRHFNEALDGAAFGAASAATFAAAQTVVVGVGVLSGGLRPAGAAGAWVERLLSIAIATPVLAMGAIGAACAAIWLRYRAPVGDRRALGPLGHPAVAIPVAAALVIVGAIGETFLPAGAWLAWLLALDLLALALLRRAVHVGLLEEADERDIGPPIVCANCGASTAQHTFCGSCGIALKALPKSRPGLLPGAGLAETGADAPAARPRGSFAGRLSTESAGGLSGRRRVLAASAMMAAAAGIGLLIGALAGPPTRHPLCRPGVQCGAPPVLAHQVSVFPGYTRWQSSGLGFSLRYDSSNWSVSSQDPDDLQLDAGDGFSALVVSGVRASQASPAALLRAQVSNLQGQLLGLSSDPNPDDAILGSNVGFIPGPGGVYTGTVATPQGPQAPASIAVLASGNASVSIVVTAIAPGNNPSDRAAVYQQADDIINSIQWPAR